MNNDQEQDRGEFAPCPLPDREQRIQDGDLMNVMRQDVIDMEAFVGSGKPVVLPFRPDWDTQAVLVEEMQRMAKRIEELEAMPKEVDVKHKTKYYALLKEYDRVCYLLDKAGMQKQMQSSVDKAVNAMTQPTYYIPNKDERTWVGLTDDEVYKIAFTLEGEHWKKIADAIEAKLKEKNT